jgi:O-succinylbenzoic acid--CoA ligase
MGYAMRLGHALDDAWLCCLPLHHIGGLSILLRCAMYATTARLEPRFEAAAVARALDSGQITLASLVPAMLSAALDARAAAGRSGPFPPALRAILLGGGPTRAPLLARCQAIGAPVSVTWGMTETGSQVATRAPGDLSPGLHAGAPLAFARVTLDGERLAVEGPVAPGGRLVSHDRGAIDGDGRVHITGRSDDVILSGGENIDPAEVEAALTDHAGVAGAAVVARSDPRWGQRPVAWLVPSAGDRPPDAELEAWCRDRLAGFKVPDAFLWCDALPRTALGKISRGLLRQRLPLDAPPRS